MGNSRIDSIIKQTSITGRRVLLAEIEDDSSDVEERYGLTSRDATELYAQLSDLVDAD